ncbi:MAG: hypothetical protein JWQ76_544 [Ramlibacter sp.]|nr:hypothetical protein [Ramlibacter sp.]
MPALPSSAAETEALYYRPGGPFEQNLPPIVPHAFRDEQARALRADAPTGMVALDLSESLKMPWPATTPVMLARYLVVRAGEELQHRFVATGEIFYVIQGDGTTASGDTNFSWSPGDVFCLPGGRTTRHAATSHAILLGVTNEPELAYQGLDAPAPERNPVRPVFFEAGKIDENLDAITDPLKTAGRAILLTASHLLATKAMIPSLSIAVNSLEPGCNQRPHRHNATALTLAIGWEGIHTRIDGERFDWFPYGVLLTPPRAVHSHHNMGTGMMRALVFQDGGLYYQYRNVGFSFEQPQPEGQTA